MSVYRAPFGTPVSRLPTWRFPNELPIEGEPADVYIALEQAHRALARSPYPFAADPGAQVPPPLTERFARGLVDCRLVPLGHGAHFLQEDHPEVIGASIRAWLTERN